jgi:hypothetical protein
LPWANPKPEFAAKIKKPKALLRRHAPPEDYNDSAGLHWAAPLE